MSLNVVYLSAHAMQTAQQLKDAMNMLDLTDVFVYQYDDLEADVNIKVPIPSTHRFVGTVTYEGECALMISKVRLTPNMMHCLFPTAYEVNYAEPASFSEANETDAKRLRKFDVGESEYGIFLSEDYEKLYPDGMEKTRLHDPTVMGMIRVSEKYEFVDVVGVSRSIIVMFFQHDEENHDVSKFYFRSTSCDDAEYQRFLKLFHETRAQYFGGDIVVV